MNMPSGGWRQARAPEPRRGAGGPRCGRLASTLGGPPGSSSGLHVAARCW